MKYIWQVFFFVEIAGIWCPTADAQVAVDLIVEGTTESTEIIPGSLVALNDDFDEKSGVKYSPPLGPMPTSFVRSPARLPRQDNQQGIQENELLGTIPYHRIKADGDHSNKSGDDLELADARVVITAPVGTTGRWITNTSAASGDLRVWWFDGTAWVQVDGGVNQTTLSPTPPVSFEVIGGLGRAVIPLKLEGLGTTAAANAVNLEAQFVLDGGGPTVSDTARVSIIDVEFEVNLSPSEGDDYLTWGPSRCRMRAVGMQGRTNADGTPANLNVVLRNSPEVDKWIPSQPVSAIEEHHRIRSSGVPDDPGRFSGGRVCFAPENLAAGATATQLRYPPSGATTLLADGSWHNFFIAGEFGRPSFFDKDTIVEARESMLEGRPLGSHRMMVRVRKQSDDLHSFEIQRLLEAMAISKDDFHGGSKRWPGSAPSGVFNRLERTHTNARLAGDEAHRGQNQNNRQAAFLPWHRAFVLDYERSLQSIPGPDWEPNRYRAVSLHYWDWDEPSSRRYSNWFLGAPQFPQTAWSSGSIGFAQFQANNPLEGWKILDHTHDRIRRRNHSATGTLAAYPGFRSTTRLLRHNVYGAKTVAPTNSWSNGFLDQMERNAHDFSHSWNCGGGQITNPAHSAKDPVFYLLHSQVDRQWAVWQNVFGRFQGDSNGYDLSNGLTLPTAGNPSYQLGAHLNDKMWPWDGTSGGTGLRQRPPITSSPFPGSGNPHLWPHSAVMPRCGDMLDYEGRADPNQSMGFCYDDVPYGRGASEPGTTTGAGVRLAVTILGGTNKAVGVPFVVEVGVVRAAPDTNGNNVPLAGAFNGTIRLSVVTGPPPDALGANSGVYITSGSGAPTATLDDDILTFTGTTGNYRVLSHSAGVIRLRAEQVDGGLPQTSDVITIN